MHNLNILLKTSWVKELNRIYHERNCFDSSSTNSRHMSVNNHKFLPSYDISSNKHKHLATHSSVFFFRILFIYNFSRVQTEQEKNRENIKRKHERNYGRKKCQLQVVYMHPVVINCSSIILNMHIRYFYNVRHVRSHFNGTFFSPLFASAASRTFTHSL